VDINLYLHELGYRIEARNKFGETAEMMSQPGDGIYEYVQRTNRLNMSYIVYWLTNPPPAMTPLSPERQNMLDFLNRADDHRHPRRIRKRGWERTAGLSDGEVISRPRKPGDVTVHGDVATIAMKVL
jgi:hypothetical protein